MARSQRQCTQRQRLAISGGRMTPHVVRLEAGRSRPWQLQLNGETIAEGPSFDAGDLVQWIKVGEVFSILAPGADILLRRLTPAQIAEGENSVIATWAKGWQPRFGLLADPPVEN